MKTKSNLNILIISLALIIFCNGGNAPYQQAKQINTIGAYVQFIQKNPQSEFVEVAKMKIDSLRFEELILKDSTQLYEDFITKYPDSNFRNKVETKLESLKYQNACFENTIQSYEEYLQNYSNGKYSKIVKSNIQKLIKEENEVLITGIVVDQNDSFVKGKTFVLGIYSDGHMVFVIGEGGKIGNPRANSDSMGRFKIKTSKDVIKEYCKNDRRLTIGCYKSKIIWNLKILLLKKDEETIIISFDQISSKMDLGKLSVNLF